MSEFYVSPESSFSDEKSLSESTNELLEPTGTQLIPGAIFRHYKNKDYLIIGVAIHTETLEELIVYRALYKSNPNSKFRDYQIWTRPKKMFLEDVEVDGKRKPRFEFISFS